MSRQRRPRRESEASRGRADGDPLARVAAAQEMAARGEADRALATLDALLAQHPRLAPAWHLEGVLLLATGRPADAAAALGRATKLAPRDVAAWTNLGIAQHEAGEPRAEASLRHALALQPRLAQAHLNLGVVLRERGDLSGAIAALREAVAIEAGYIKGWLELGLCLQESGALDEAIEVYRAALGRDRSLYPAILRNLTSSSKGRLWLSPADLRRALLR